VRLLPRWVRWILLRDPGARFRFAPLAGETFASRAPADRGGMRGTIVLETADGRWLPRSDAVIAVLRTPGRRRTAAAGAAVPRFLREAAYRAVAAVRGRFRRPRGDACPVLAPDPRARFDP